ncbi:MAG TPA: hypothetical protein PKD55_02065 [Bellilinea sp.]|nr:hypothetical protein [Bellilinea sp.]
MRKILTLIITMTSGLLVLIASMLPGTLASTIYSTLTNWLVLLAAFAGIVTIIHLMRQHWGKLIQPQTREINSAFVLISFAVTLGLGIYLGSSHPLMQNLITHVQFPIESTLLGILCVVFIVGAIKLYQNKPGWMSFVFLLSTILFLIVGSGVLALDPRSNFWKEALAAINTLPIAGSRGILIGVAIGAIVTGVRAIFGIDRKLEG